MDAEAWNRRYDQTELVWSAGPNQFLPPVAAALPPGRAADLACGEGRNAIWLAEQGWEVTAVDFAGVALAKGRRLAEARDASLTWVEQDVTSWSADGDQDLVLVFYLQVPAPELAAALGAAVGALRPGGTLLAVGHDRDNLERGYGGPQDPAVLWTTDAVVDVVTGADPSIEVISAGPVIRRVEQDDVVHEAIDCLVQARRR